MYLLQIYGLLLEFIGVFLITYETIKGQQYHDTRTEIKDSPRYYERYYDKHKGVQYNQTNFPNQWKRLILWLFIIILGLINQMIGIGL